jgi:hypothetical protein
MFTHSSWYVNVVYLLQLVKALDNGAGGVSNTSENISRVGRSMGISLYFVFISNAMILSSLGSEEYVMGIAGYLISFAAKIWLNAAIFAYAYRASKIGAHKPATSAQINSHSNRSNNASLGTDSTHSTVNGKNVTATGAAIVPRQSRFTPAAPNSANRRTMINNDVPSSVHARPGGAQYNSARQSTTKRSTSGSSGVSATSSSQQVHATAGISDEEQGINNMHHQQQQHHNDSCGTTGSTNTQHSTTAVMVPAVISRALFSKGSVLTDEEKSARDHTTAYQNIRAHVHGSGIQHLKTHESSTIEVEEYQQDPPTGRTNHQQQSSTTRLLEA